MPPAHASLQHLPEGFIAYHAPSVLVAGIKHHPSVSHQGLQGCHCLQVPAGGLPRTMKMIRWHSLVEHFVQVTSVTVDAVLNFLGLW